MIVKHIDTYLSEEGNLNQELGYAIQMVHSASARQILEQMKTFRKWVQSVANRSSDEKMVPFVYIGFGKTLTEREI